MGNDRNDRHLGRQENHDPDLASAVNTPSLDYGWISAKQLKPGINLKTPDGQSAVVVGGSVPAVHDGWMWDLTVPGNNDHDFYVAVAATAVLVHNIGGVCPVQTGQAGENAAGITKNTDSIQINGRTRIPDELNDTTLGEVKNVGYQYLSTQLKDFLAYAQQNSLNFNLYVRASTRLSGPLQDLVDSGQINRVDILP
jgi:restriction endonuclease fold toxin 7 of polymorphic toxin system